MVRERSRVQSSPTAPSKAQKSRSFPPIHLLGNVLVMCFFPLISGTFREKNRVKLTESAMEIHGRFRGFVDEFGWRVRGAFVLAAMTVLCAIVTAIYWLAGWRGNSPLYQAGWEAGLSGFNRVAPADFTDAEKADWLAGYDDAENAIW